ncbi:MAG: hypothetical protein LBI02_10305, partial [Opitutaceae bacterium]|nr:hypothetical protein [Opitutaceae bacterium]
MKPAPRPALLLNRRIRHATLATLALAALATLVSDTGCAAVTNANNTPDLATPASATPASAIPATAIASSATDRQRHRQPERPRAPGRDAVRARPVPAWVTPLPGNAAASGLERHTFDSAAAGEKVSYLICLPPGYREKSAATARYPVLYWLHGLGGSQWGAPGFCERLRAAIAAGKAPSMLVVFVNGMVDSFYCDAAAARRPVETVIIHELIPHIDATWRTIAAREGRAIEGFSMGGFGAAHLGFKHPGLFGAVSMIDAALIDAATLENRHTAIFQHVFGGDADRFRAAHPLALAEKNAAQIRDRIRIRQVCGPLVRPNRALHEKLAALGIAHEFRVLAGAPHNQQVFYERLGDDNWLFYQRAFAATAPSATSL